MQLAPCPLATLSAACSSYNLLGLLLTIVYLQEVKQQTMADYAAELQAQIAEKEKQKRLRRQNSLRESQQLMAQRMTVPSGLVSL